MKTYNRNYKQRGRCGEREILGQLIEKKDGEITEKVAKR